MRNIIKFGALSLAAASFYMWSGPIAREGGAQAVMDEVGMVIRSAYAVVAELSKDLPATVEAQYDLAKCVYQDQRDYLHDRALVERGVPPKSDSMQDQMKAKQSEVEARARLGAREMKRAVGLSPCR